MVCDKDAMHTEVKFHQRLQDVLLNDGIDKIYFKKGQYWFSHRGQEYNSPIKNIWCDLLMDYLYIDLKDDMSIMLRIRPT